MSTAEYRFIRMREDRDLWAATAQDHADELARVNAERDRLKAECLKWRKLAISLRDETVALAGKVDKVRLLIRGTQERDDDDLVQLSSTDLLAILGGDV